jgi:hypothetical protein
VSVGFSGIQMLHNIVTPTGVEGQPSCYQRFPGPLNWTASRDDCAARGAALLTTRQQYMSDAGILSAALRRWSGSFMGASRGRSSLGVQGRCWSPRDRAIVLRYVALTETSLVTCQWCATLPSAVSCASNWTWVDGTSPANLNVLRGMGMWNNLTVRRWL